MLCKLDLILGRSAALRQRIPVPNRFKRNGRFGFVFVFHTLHTISSALVSLAPEGFLESVRLGIVTLHERLQRAKHLCPWHFDVPNGAKVGTLLRIALSICCVVARCRSDLGRGRAGKRPGAPRVEWEVVGLVLDCLSSSSASRDVV